MQNNIFLDTFKTLGTNAVPMAFGEVFTALETKTIDGQENPVRDHRHLQVLRSAEVPDASRRHAYTPFLVLYSKKLWDQLIPQEQAVLRRGCRRRPERSQRAANRALNEQVAGQPEGQGHARQRDHAGRAATHVREGQAGLRQERAAIGAEPSTSVMDALKKARGE